MTAPLKLLMIEDTPADFILIERHLRTHGLDAECTRVSAVAELEPALGTGCWDALLSDFNVPGMDIEIVLQDVIRRFPDLPVILVSGSVGEEKAVELLKGGVWDFVLKDSLGRLVPSLNRALREAADRHALQAEQRRQRHLVENIGQGILLVDTAGTIFLTNPALDRMFGYEAGELLGQTVELLVCEEDRAAHLGKRLDYMHDPSPRTVWQRGTVRGRRKDGSGFPIEVALNPYQDTGETFVQASVTDVTERAQTERDLHIAATVFEVREGVMVTDRDNRILRVNRAFTEITGYGEAEVLGRNPSLLKSGLQDQEFYRDMWQTLQREGRWAGELQDRHKSGRIYPKWLTISVLTNAGGEVSHYVGVFTDLTKEKQAERALAANAAKSAFLANMSHEIRTPMNGVVGMTDILMETALTREQRRMVKTIRDSSLSLLGILDDILDFSKIEAGKLSLEAVPTCVPEVAEQVVRLLIPNAAAREIDFHVFIDPALPLWIAADPLRLRQIMFNLLGNAIKFTQSESATRGRVVLRLEPVAKEGGAPALCISVEDNGIGIHPEALGRLFQPFTQADGGTTRRFGGTGLGLSITKRLVELMQGSIEVSSVPQQGTQFTVTLPLTPAPAGHPLPASVDLGGVRVLAIVPDPVCTEVLQAYLTNAGAQVAVVSSLEQAQQQLQGADVLVLDFLLAAAAAAIPALAALPWVQLARRGDVFPSDGEKLHVHKAPLLYHDLIHSVAIASGKLSVRDVVGMSERRRRPRTAMPTVDEAAAAGRLVLLAEDNETNREVIQQQLQLLGYASVAVRDGEAALQHWRSGRYALLLTDCHMPKMDGFQLTATIRAEEPAGTHLPIVAVTANALQGEAGRCLEAGMDGYLSKPLRLDELGAMLVSQLPQHKPEASAPSPAPAASSSKESGLPVWDAGALARLVGEQPDVHRRLLDKFQANAEKQTASIWAAAQEGDALLVAEVAHKLKSAARSVGALALGALCEQLELAGRQGNLQAIGTLSDALGGAYANFAECVRAAGHS